MTSSQGRIKKSPSFNDYEGFFIIKPNSELNGYVFMKEIGQGSFGRVYLISKNDQIYAAKVSRKGAQFEQALQKEIVFLKLLGPKQISPLLIESFVFEGFLFAIIEYCYESLEEFLTHTRFGLPFKVYKKFAINLTQKLISMHELGIIHADIKPSNVMFLKQGDVDSLRIIDYGTSAVNQDDLGIYLQSRWFRAPEVLFKQRPYTNKIDMWGLGCVLYLCRRNNYLFQAPSNEMLCKQFIALLGMPPKFCNQFFVPYQFNYFFSHKGELEKLGLNSHEKFYPNELVLTQAGKEQCECRELQVECQNFTLDEVFDNSEYVYKLIRGLICYSINERWSAKEVLQYLEK